MRSGIGRLHELVDALLTYAGVTQHAPVHGVVDLAAVVGRVTEALSAAIADRGVDLRTDVEPGILAAGGPSSSSW